MKNDETGVGAIIAIGNQVEKGIWALFVKAINNKKIITNSFILYNNVISPIINNNPISPNRFKIIVTIPEVKAFISI